jgi:hypothetical protein
MQHCGRRERPSLDCSVIYARMKYHSEIIRNRKLVFVQSPSFCRRWHLVSSESRRSRKRVFRARCDSVEKVQVTEKVSER